MHDRGSEVYTLHLDGRQVWRVHVASRCACRQVRAVSNTAGPMAATNALRLLPSSLLFTRPHGPSDFSSTVANAAAQTRINLKLPEHRTLLLVLFLMFGQDADECVGQRQGSTSQFM